MTPPIIVYHIAAMGNWRDVIRDQFFRLRQCGLSQAISAIGDSVRITHVGQGLDIVKAEAAMQDVPITVVKSDPNTDHYETFAMLEIERLAKVDKVERPVLYFHTKGVSNPADANKYWWRMTMEHYVLDKWRENLDMLKERDAVGFNWWTSSPEHFSGTFWMANADWIRQLPNFVTFHHSHNLVRFSCELWIGSCQRKRCNAYSYGCMDQRVWQGELNWSTVLPPSRPHPTPITFVSAATSSHITDLTRLQESVKKLGEGFSLITKKIDTAAWRHCIKLKILEKLLDASDTDHVFWIDADCEFLCRLTPDDLIRAGKDYSCVQHIAYDNPLTILPARMHGRMPAEIHDIYWQSCLFGGTKDALRELLRSMDWIYQDERGYDEHAINIALHNVYDQVYTLPCRYAAPSTFRGMPQYREVYESRSGGAARILHHNRDINK